MLSGYNRKYVARSMHRARQCVYGDTVHSSDMLAAYGHKTLGLLPMPRGCHIAKVLSYTRWLAKWKGNASSTWSIPERASSIGITNA